MPDAPINVLLIAYYFPPLGLGGVWRALELYKYLERYNITPHVLTVKNIVYPEYDNSLLDDVDTSRIYRAGSLDPSRLLYLAGIRNITRKSDVGTFSSGILRRPDFKRGWNYFAHGSARSIIEKCKIKCIITTSPPPSTHMIGLKLKTRYNLPWIADFQDFWHSLPIEKVYHRQSQIEFARELKDKIIRSADEVVGVNQSIISYLGRGELIYNAADDGVIDYWKNRDKGDESKFKIGVLGTISRLTPIEPLFAILSEVIKSRSELRKNIFVTHAGKCNPEEVLMLAHKYNLGENVRLLGYLSHQRAIESLADSNLLYIAVQDQGEYHILPGRIFDMLVSGKPILAVTHPDSDLAELLKKRENNIVTDFINFEWAAGRMFELIDGPIDFSDDNQYVNYTATAMVQKYSSLIKNITAGR